MATSRVKSIRLDLWTEKHLKMLESGGNSRFKEFLVKFNLLEISDLKVRYCTVAAEFYR